MSVSTSVATELQSYRSIESCCDYVVELYSGPLPSSCLVTCCNGASTTVVPNYLGGKRTRTHSDELCGNSIPSRPTPDFQAQQVDQVSLKAVPSGPADNSHLYNDLPLTASKQDATQIKPLCPPHGAKAICGKRTSMEDEFTVKEDLLCVFNAQQLQQSPDLLPLRIAEKYKDSCSDLCDGCVRSVSSCKSTSSASSTTSETIHFFGVYDGHGGPQASKHCKERLHQHVTDALSAMLPACTSVEVVVAERSSPMQDTPDSAAASAGTESGTAGTGAAVCHVVTNRANGGLHREGGSDASDLSTSPSTSPHSSCSEERGDGCYSKLIEAALKIAFQKTDEEFGADECSALVGSTAVVVLVGGSKYYVANCGDSRAVLFRGGKAMQLTDDHKPERQDEAERVEKAGGQVLFWNGHRVMGVLAMSRAIGDHMLRPYVIAEPEVTIMSRHVEDELLLLASDGLWDVMSNQEASSLASRCLKRAKERGASCKAAARIAASVLTRAAMDRGSKDNITVVIVDLHWATALVPRVGAPESGCATGDNKDCGPCRMEITESGPF